MQTDRAGEAFEIRPYTRKDRFALARMYEAFEPKRGAQGLRPAYDEGIRRWLERVLASGVHLLALGGSHIIGHVMLIPKCAGEFELANFVHQSRRDRGIGTALNRAAVSAARQQSAHRVWLCVEPSNRAALKSYQRAGFHILPGHEWAPEIEMAVDLVGEEASGERTA
jgi:ribosomal protein S18 acetylase RimI-like enzyme